MQGGGGVRAREEETEGVWGCAGWWWGWTMSSSVGGRRVDLLSSAVGECN